MMRHSFKTYVFKGPVGDASIRASRLMGSQKDQRFADEDLQWYLEQHLGINWQGLCCKCRHRAGSLTQPQHTAKGLQAAAQTCSPRNRSKAKQECIYNMVYTPHSL